MMSPKKKIYISLLLLALFIELPLLFWLKDSWYPYLIKPNPSTFVNTGYFDYFYHDLNNDGDSEFFEIENNPDTQNYNIKIYSYNSGNRVLINQWNFQSLIHIKDLAFRDLDGDGWQEIIVFTNDESYLYLSIINTNDSTQEPFVRYALIPAPKKNPFTYWDVESFNPLFWDVNNDKQPELIFTVHSGLSLQPRGVYAFDFKSKQIIRRFEYHAGAARLALQDVNNDQQKELIVTTYATSNYPNNSQYSDQWSWLFVLNKNFKPIVPPNRFGSRFSVLASYAPMRLQPGRLIIYFRESDDNILLMRFDSLHLAKIISLPQPVDFYLAPNLVHTQHLLYLCYRSLARLDVVDQNLSLVKKIKISNNSILTHAIFCKNGLEGKSNFLIANLLGVTVYDSSFHQLARLPLDKKVVKHLSFIQHKKQAALQLAVTTNDFFMQYSVRPNPFFIKFPYLFVLFLLFLYGILMVTFIGMNKLRLYYSYLFFSMRQSDNAIMLLNHSGRVLTFNKKVEQWFKVSLQQRKIHYGQVFKDMPQILETINRAIKAKKSVKCSLRLESDVVLFYGEISVTPFFSFFNYAHAFLVELRDNTAQILLERQQNWQQSVRSLVHDLKNPLAGLQLKIQTLYLKLRKKYPQDVEALQQDLEIAYSEIKRIRQISLDFLKFTQLEQIQFKRVKLNQFIKNILNHFDAFQSDFLKIELNTSTNVPEFVYWDPRQIELLLHILIKNAIDAMSRNKGEIVVNIHSTDEFKIQEGVVISIKDTGNGIPDAIQDKIFDPFFTTKKEGSGMGLAFARQIVIQHKGKIELVKMKERGAQFLIKLPINPRLIKNSEK